MVREQTPTITPPPRSEPRHSRAPARRRTALAKPLTLKEHLRVRLKTAGMSALLADLEERHGPIPEDLRQRAERAWRGD